MTDKKIEELIESELSGTSGVGASPETIAETLGISEDEVLRVCGEIGVENCAECGWWTFRDEACEHDGEMYCTDCAPREDC